ncbi:Globin domain containing protein [Asbolus verrucosus]|uniref:Globin domain containing protein n=1 Tax=Asbolus verrucosus TaxID=1661398 RepID=A0A482W298_ASBVE|nr:Globin domain containing protein [Asbolus verrucosus]
MGIITSSFITNDADPVTGLTPTERNLVQNSWAPLKNDLTGTGIKLLLAFYEKYPEELQYFPFRHVPREALSGDKKFQGFCSMVIRALDSLIDSLNDSELLMNLLQNVGRGHRKYGIKPQSFWVAAMGIITSSYYYYSTRTDDPDETTGLTSRQRYLVQSSWAPMKKDLTGNGVKLLLFLFKKFPEEHQNFPFRDIPYEELHASKRFHAHCSNVMYAVDAIIDSLNDSELLVNILQKIGKNHHRNNVKPISFWHVKETMLEYFATYMSKETLDAWDKSLQVAFGVVGDVLDGK